MEDNDFYLLKKGGKIGKETSSLISLVEKKKKKCNYKYALSGSKTLHQVGSDFVFGSNPKSKSTGSGTV